MKVKVGEVNISFTQVYDCIIRLTMRLKIPTSRQALDLIFDEMAKDNMFKSDQSLCDKYNAALADVGLEPVTRSTFQRYIKDLASVFLIIAKGSRGTYMVNPYIAWKGQPQERALQLKVYSSFNPLNLEL